jgi:hypothetical protein
MRPIFGFESMAPGTRGRNSFGPRAPSVSWRALTQICVPWVSMVDTARSLEDFQALIQPLFGLAVSLPWKGYGSAVFLELGALAALKSSRQHYNDGEACIAVDWDWRVEAEHEVVFGSSNSRPEIEAGLRSLRGSTVEAIAVVGQVPELVVDFSNGFRLRSMAMLSGDPEWSIKLLDGRRIRAQGGQLLVGVPAAPLSEEEMAAFDLAERTATRWGTPCLEPKLGSCGGCAFFVPLDGEGHLLDYGCCVADAGPFDGRVVARSSGCPCFTGEDES